MTKHKLKNDTDKNTDRKNGTNKNELKILSNKRFFKVLIQNVKKQT
jgi:hypothetical protein